MAGRIRSLKPEWLEDEPLVACSDAARVLSAALLLLSDDYGNGRAGQVYLSSHVFPNRDSQETLVRALEELVQIRYVVLYVVDSQRYFHVRNWKKHQKVNHPGKPLVPSFPGEPAEALLQPQEVLSPDRDRDRRPTTGTDDQEQEQDRDARGTATTEELPEPEQAPDGLVPMQSGWSLDPEVRACLETELIPTWAIDALVQRARTHYAGNPEDRRKRSAWNQAVAKWVRRDFKDPATRPERPTEGAESDQRAAAIQRDYEAKLAAKTAEAQAFLARSGKPIERDLAKLIEGIG